MTRLWRPTTRVRATIAGIELARFTTVQITRSLQEISASFVLELRDDARNLASWPFASPGDIGPLLEGQPILIELDGETILVGHAEDVYGDFGDGSVAFAVAGRDITGDLVDCAAAPRGPHEFRNVTVVEFAERVCRPFGISVRCDVDPGPPFEKASIDAAETALSAIEKLARQRKLLVTSDGVEGLLLTRSGKDRAAGDIRAPGPGVLSGGFSRSQRDRYSDYFVKGQAGRAGGTRQGGPALGPNATPKERVRDYLGISGSASASPEARGVTIAGHARDPEVTRWRPVVAQMKSQESAGGAQRQAEWMAGVHKARGVDLAYELADWRGATGDLWRPNTLAFVADRYRGDEEEYLIDAVTLSYGEGESETTTLRLVGPEAYDEEP